MLTCGEEGEGDEEAVADEKSHLDLDLKYIFFFWNQDDPQCWIQDLVQLCCI